MKIAILTIGFVLASLPSAMADNTTVIIHNNNTNVVNNNGRDVDNNARYVGTNNPHSFTNVGKNLDVKFDKNFTITSQIDRITDKQVFGPVEKTRTIEFEDYRQVWGTKTRIVCDDVGFNGKMGKGLDAFYQAPKSEKAKALDDAVKGIGLESAKILIKRGYFGGGRKKPANWAEFSEIIESATLENAELRNLSYEVLDKYGTENQENLGYYSRKYCRVERYPALVWEKFMNQREERYVENEWRTVEQRDPFKTVSKEFTVQGTGGKLLKGESETITVNFDGMTYSLPTQGLSRYNTYTVKRAFEDNATGKVTFVLEGQRKAITPDNTLSVSPRLGSDAKLKVTDSGFDRDGSGQGIIHYKVMQRTPSSRLFGFGGPKDEVLSEGSAPLSLDSDTTEVPLKVSRGKDTQVWVEYSLQRTDTQFYNTNQSETITTDKQ